MPRKSFRVAAATEPIEFDVEGARAGMQYFQCRDRLAAGTLMRFAESFSSIQDDADEAEQAKQSAQAIPAVKDFFNSVLLPEGRDRFWQLINSDDEGVPLDTLVEIASWLSEVYSGGRPTGTNSGSTSPGISTGGGSPAGPSDVGTPTYSRSELTSSSTS